MKNTITNPLILTYRPHGLYTANKNNCAGEYVDKAVADKLLEALQYAKKALNENGLFGITIIDEAMKKAIES